MPKPLKSLVYRRRRRANFERFGTISLTTFSVWDLNNNNDS